MLRAISSLCGLQEDKCVLQVWKMWKVAVWLPDWVKTDNQHQLFQENMTFLFSLLSLWTVTVADYISRAESQSRQITKDSKKMKDVVSTQGALTQGSLYHAYARSIPSLWTFYIVLKHGILFEPGTAGRTSAGTVARAWVQRLLDSVNMIHNCDKGFMLVRCSSPVL